jgi:hypothetical protein
MKTPSPTSSKTLMNLMRPPEKLKVLYTGACPKIQTGVEKSRNKNANYLNIQRDVIGH